MRDTAKPAGSTTSARWTGIKLDTPLFLMFTLVPPRNLSQNQAREGKRNRESNKSGRLVPRNGLSSTCSCSRKLLLSRLFCSPDTMCVYLACIAFLSLRANSCGTACCFFRAIGVFGKERKWFFDFRARLLGSWFFMLFTL